MPVIIISNSLRSVYAWLFRSSSVVRNKGERSENDTGFTNKLCCISKCCDDYITKKAGFNPKSLKNGLHICKGIFADGVLAFSPAVHHLIILALLFSAGEHMPFNPEEP
jgi:hypothetical protein